MSQSNAKVPIPWRTVKKTPIKNLFLPIHNGSDYRQWNLFRALDHTFQTQSQEHQKNFGAVHIRFEKDVERKVQMTPEDFTVFNDVRHCKWSESKKPGIFIDRNNGKAHGNNGTASSLLETDNLDNAPPGKLTPDSTLEDLDKFMRDSRGSYSIGTKGRTVASENLTELGPFNMYAINDFLTGLDKEKFDSLDGLVTPWAITGRRNTLTAMHLEDLMFASINSMVLKGDKLWFFLNSDVENIKRFAENAAAAVQKLTGVPYCEASQTCKMWSFSPRVLNEWGVEYRLLWQTGADVVVSEAYGFHQTVNVTGNITLARNLVYSRTPQVFDNSFLKCECKDHEKVDLELSQLEYAQWVRANLESSKLLALRLTTFQVLNVRWSSRALVQEIILERNNAKFQQFLRMVNGKKPTIIFIGSRKNSTGKQSRDVLVDLENIENVRNEAIKDALATLFTPYGVNNGTAPTLQIEACAHKDLVNKLGFEPKIVRGGYVDIPLEAGVTSKDFDKIRGIWFDGMRKCHRFYQVPEIGITFCQLCGCRNAGNHDRGRRHKQFLRVLIKVHELYEKRKENACATLQCPICPTGDITSAKSRLQHQKSPLHRRATKIRNLYFYNPNNFTQWLPRQLQ